MKFACDMPRWYICYLVFIIVGTYYINILVNVVLVLSTAIVMDGQGYKTIQEKIEEARPGLYIINTISNVL